MVKRPFLIFVFVLAVLITGVISFLESHQFAKFVQGFTVHYLPKDSGIDARFSEFSIRFFPPGFSIKNPKIELKENNIAKLPAGSSIFAERIDFKFLPFQILSGGIRISELGIVNGRVQVLLDEKALKKSPSQKDKKFGFHWDELLQIKAEAITLENVAFDVKLIHSGQSIFGSAVSARFAQWAGRGGLGYSLDLNLKGIGGNYLKSLYLPEQIHEVQLKSYVNALALRLDNFVLSGPGIQLAFVGKVDGNLLKSQELIADGNLKLNGQISDLVNHYPGIKISGEIPKGELFFEGKFQGDLLKISETMKANGNLKVEQVSYSKWKADQIVADAEWIASPRGGEVLLKKAVISSDQKPRSGIDSPGDGGKVEIGPAKWTIGSLSKVVIPTHFEHAHIHWLGGPAIKKIFPLDFRLNGSILMNFIPATKSSSWEIQADLKTWVEQFQLDNQKYQRKKDLKVVFKFPKLSLDGQLAMNSNGLNGINVKAGFSHTQLKAVGKIDFNKGFDLRVNGPVNLEEVDQIAENNIRGLGTLSSYIHGPLSKVVIDIDADIKNGSYLNLNLGDFKGRVTWDDDPNHLIFSKIELKKDHTLYSLNGMLDLGDADTIDLDVHVFQGTVSEIINITHHLTKDISWFPKTLNGAVNGDVKIGGGISLSKMNIFAQMSGNNWDYVGESFKRVKLTGGYDRGRYYISDFWGLKRSGLLRGSISLETNKKLIWNLASESLSLTDLDHIAQLDVPIRGRIEVRSSGKGLIGEIDSQTFIDLQDFSVRGLAMPPSQFSLKTQNGIARAQGLGIGGQGVLDVIYNFDPKQLSTVKMDLKHLDFSPLLLLLNPKSIQDPNLMGFITGDISLNFHSGRIEEGSGSMRLSEYLLSRVDSKFQLGQPVAVEIKDGNFEIGNLSFVGKEGNINLLLKGRAGKLEGQLLGSIDNSIVEFFTPVVNKATGVSKVNVSIHGSIKEPVVLGTAHLKGGSVRVASLEAPFENISGKLQLKQNLIQVESVQADVGGGRTTVDGSVTVNADRYPDIDLKMHLAGPKLKIFPFQFVKARGLITVQGNEIPYLVEGNINIESALSKEKILNQKKGAEGFKTIQYAPPPTKQGESNYPKFKLNLMVDANHDILIQNDLFKDVQVKGHLNVVNTLNTPRLLGNVEVLQGKIIFKDHIFQIQSATANFDNPTQLNPIVDLVAKAEISGVKIQLFATGRPPDKIKVEFTSNPAMQESEILSLLAVGLTPNDAKRLNANDLNTLQQGEAASLILHSLDFNRELEDKTGFHVQVDESINGYQGVSAFRPQAQGDASAAPQITIRRKLGDRLSVSAGSTVGVGTNKSNQFNLDYSISPDTSITGVIKNYGTYGTSETLPTATSAGFDLKFQKRFK